MQATFFNKVIILRKNILVREFIIFRFTHILFNSISVRNTEDFLFTRCMKCNCGDFLKLSQSVMKELKKNSSKKTNEEGFGTKAATPLWVDGIDVVNAKTTRDVSLQIDDVVEAVIEVREDFYACEDCGKFYWTGSHWDRASGGKRC